MTRRGRSWESARGEWGSGREENRRRRGFASRPVKRIASRSDALLQSRAAIERSRGVGRRPREALGLHLPPVFRASREVVRALHACIRAANAFLQVADHFTREARDLFRPTSGSMHISEGRTHPAVTSVCAATHSPFAARGWLRTANAEGRMLTRAVPRRTRGWRQAPIGRRGMNRAGRATPRGGGVETRGRRSIARKKRRSPLEGRPRTLAAGAQRRDGQTRKSAFPARKRCRRPITAK
jgi:hypothetical protein